MIDKIDVQAVPAPRCDYNKKSLHRINRIMGQLEGLKRMVEADTGSCEDRVIRARTIEKAVASLTRHMVECYMVNTAQHEMVDDPEKVTQDMLRIFELMNK